MDTLQTSASTGFRTASVSEDALMGTSMIKPHRQTLKREAADYIRNLIFSGKVHAGERIDQDGIAAALDVSRIPIREALISLESEGMVVNIARRGAFVARLERGDILDHFRMYGLLNGIAARRIAEREDPEVDVSAVVERLDLLCKQMRETSDPSEHDRLNYAFHREINLAGGSRRLLSVLRILAANMPSQFFEANSEWEFADHTFAEHDDIVRFIAAGDGSGAAASLEQHFVHTGQQAVRTLEASGFWTVTHT